MLNGSRPPHSGVTLNGQPITDYLARVQGSDLRAALMRFKPRRGTITGDSMFKPGDKVKTQEKIRLAVEANPQGLFLDELAKRAGVEIGKQRAGAIVRSLGFPKKRVGFGPGSRWCVFPKVPTHDQLASMAKRLPDKIVAPRGSQRATGPSQMPGMEAMMGYLVCEVSKVIAEVQSKAWIALLDHYNGTHRGK